MTRSLANGTSDDILDNMSNHGTSLTFTLIMTLRVNVVCVIKRGHHFGIIISLLFFFIYSYNTYIAHYSQLSMLKCAKIIDNDTAEN